MGNGWMNNGWFWGGGMGNGWVNSGWFMDWRVYNGRLRGVRRANFRRFGGM